MEDLILLLTASLVYYRSSKEVKTSAIGNTPCSLHFATDEEMHRTVTECGDELYLGEYRRQHTSYGFICGVLKEPLNYEESYQLLANYLNDLHQPFSIAHNTGVQDVAKRKTVYIELHDFWQDESGMDWEVKGYTNGHYVAVLYVKNIGAVHSSRQQAYLNSFSFGNE